MNSQLRLLIMKTYDCLLDVLSNPTSTVEKCAMIHGSWVDITDYALTNGYSREDIIALQADVKNSPVDGLTGKRVLK